MIIVSVCWSWRVLDKRSLLCFSVSTFFKAEIHNTLYLLCWYGLWSWWIGWMVDYTILYFLHFTTLSFSLIARKYYAVEVFVLGFWELCVYVCEKSNRNCYSRAEKKREQGKWNGWIVWMPCHRRERIFLSLKK